MLNSSMTLYDLIETLTEIRDARISNGENDDIIVVSSSDYGDYSHTEQLVEIQSIETVNPTRSAYSKSGWAYPDDVDDPDVNQDEEVIVLRYC